MNTTHEILCSLEENFRQYHRLLKKLENECELPSAQQEQLAAFLNTLRSIQDEVLDFRLTKILTEEHPYIPRIIVPPEDSTTVGLRQLAVTFLRRRSDLLNTLRSLPAESWNRTGVHEIEGHISYKEIIRRMVRQDLSAIGRLSNDFFVVYRLAFISCRSSAGPGRKSIVGG